MLYNYVDTGLDDNLVSSIPSLSLAYRWFNTERLLIRLLQICCICRLDHRHYGDVIPDFDFRAPFNEPVTTRTCFHTFCQECILQALSVSNHCPIDRSPLLAELLGQADPIVRHVRGAYFTRVSCREGLLTGYRCSSWMSWL